MRLNRERVVLLPVALIFLVTAWTAVAGFLEPRPNIRVPDTTLRQTSPAIARPRFARFETKSAPTRNPFRFAEGWQPLDPPSLSPPPIVDRARILPLPPVLGEPGNELFAFVEPAPPETKDDDKKKGDDAKESETRRRAPEGRQP
ncbi:MAG TPA: hypothetical protein VK116_09690 [Planctomycetota bacterium]|nr:hypothetical protein [Planctomycetota bacterium]